MSPIAAVNLINQAAIAATSFNTGRLDAFGLGINNQIYHKSLIGETWNPAMTADFESLGGVFHSAPAVAAMGTGYQLLAVGADSHMYHKSYINSVYSPAMSAEWSLLGGQFASVPVMLSRSSTLLDVLALGTDNQLYYNSYNGQAFQKEFTSIGSNMIGVPAMVAMTPERLDVLSLGQDSLLYHSALLDQQITTQQQFTAIGTQTLISPPSVVALGASQFDVVALGAQSQVLRQSYINNAFLPAYEDLGGRFISQPVAIALDDASYNVFAIGQDQQMYYQNIAARQAYNSAAAVTAASAASWTALGGQFAAAAPAVTLIGPSTVSVQALGTDNVMYRKEFAGAVIAPSTAAWQNLSGNFISQPIIA